MRMKIIDKRCQPISDRTGDELTEQCRHNVGQLRIQLMDEVERKLHAYTQGFEDRRDADTYYHYVSDTLADAYRRGWWDCELNITACDK
jgi:hypothetical protein